MKVSEIKEKMEELERIERELINLSDFSKNSGGVKVTLLYKCTDTDKLVFLEREEVLSLTKELALLKRERILKLTQELNKANISFEHGNEGFYPRENPFELVKGIIEKVKERTSEREEQE